MNDTGSSPGARFSFSPRMRWSLINSTSLIPGAFLLAMLKVTGPAGTLPLSALHESLPPSLAIVMLTAVTPLAPEAGAAPVPLLVLLLELHPPVAATATAATRTGVASQPLPHGNLVSLRCFTMVLLFPFVSGGSAGCAQCRKDKERGSDGQHRRQPRLPQHVFGARPGSVRNLCHHGLVAAAEGGPVAGERADADLPFRLRKAATMLTMRVASRPSRKPIRKVPTKMPCTFPQSIVAAYYPRFALASQSKVCLTLLDFAECAYTFGEVHRLGPQSVARGTIGQRPEESGVASALAAGCRSDRRDSAVDGFELLVATWHPDSRRCAAARG